MSFQEISINEISKNAFDLIGKDWFLVCSGNQERCNCMTASWGQMGILWNKPVFTTVIRPQRYTYEFMEANEFAAICFFDDAYRSQLTFCGRNSGRDVDKIAETGFTPIFDHSTFYFEEAKMVLICKKIYVQDMKKDCFLGDDGEKHYPTEDFHRAYTLEIQKVLVKS